MSKELRWGLLSTAHINEKIIAPLSHSKRNELVAVASRKLDSAIAYAEKWEIGKAYGSYEELLADPNIDVIYNSLPNSLHAEWTIKALRAGKNVLCEKPLATKVEEIDDIMSAVRETGKIATEAFMYRHHAQTLRVKELIKSNTIGKISLMRGIFCFRLTNSMDIRYRQNLGGGSIWDIGCYPINYIRYLCGMEPYKVFAFKVDSGSGVDQSMTGEMSFFGSIVGQFQCSFTAPSYTLFEIFGEKGYIRIPNPFKVGTQEKFYLWQDGEEKEITVNGNDPYAEEIEDIASAILDKKQQLIPLMDSRNNVRIIQKLLESAQSGMPV